MSRLILVKRKGLQKGTDKVPKRWDLSVERERGTERYHE